MIVPDAVEPIVGWRYWSLNQQGRLESLVQERDAPWVPGVRKEAECGFLAMIRAWEQRVAEVRQRETPSDPEPLEQPKLEGPDMDEHHPEWDEHEAPLESCSCGIHAAKDLETLQRVSGGGPVVGEVYLWGKVIPGENGYRAQYAYPKSLYLVSRNDLDGELAPLSAYCEDVGVMTPREAWGPWGRRILLSGLSIGRMMIGTRLGVTVIVLAVWGLRAFLD
jgi:hypothetical protein